MSFGMAITLVRTAKGMGRKDVASAAGISYPYMAELENDAKEPSLRVLNKLSDALGMKVIDLLSLGDDIKAGKDITIPAGTYRVA